MIKYAITDPSFFNPYNPYLYFKTLKADFVLFRDKNSQNYKKDATVFINNAKDYSFKKIIHQDYKLAKELNASGVHLTSKQFEDIKKAKELSLFTIISTHSLEEIKKAKELQADAVTFSPIFKTPNKGEPKGLKELEEALKIDIKIIALGGIVTKEHIELIKKLNPYGFASIRYFASY